MHATNNRVLDIEGVVNFRDLGGYQNNEGREVKWGLVYRSAQLDKIPEQGIQQMAALGIKTVVDLRFTEETERYPTIRAAVPEAEILSWHGEAQTNDNEPSGSSDAMKRSWRASLETGDPEKVREAMRVNYPQKLYSHAKIYRKMLQRLAHEQTPLVFHCAAGKDRTGVAAALILSLLGVSDELIIEDYLLTQQARGALMENWAAGGATDANQHQDFQSRLASLPIELVQPVFEADIRYIETLLEYVNSKYKGFVNYALELLELDSQVLDDLRLQLLA